MEDKLKMHLSYFSRMILIRYFEEKLDWLFSRDMLPGTAHLCIGQEAVAVGAMEAIEPTDFVISTHRGHGHILAKEADPKRLFCEIMGKEPGYCKGKGGTQHICALELGFLGTNGITGGGIPIATGVGMALKLQKRPEIVLCFFGDGASNQGTFHESLNMASIWKVPIVYICENNLYAMSTPVGQSMNIKDIAIRAASYGIPGEIVDGMNVVAVKDAVSVAVDRARKGKGATFIEAKTYRYCGHSKSDIRKYRTRKEEDQWKTKDPTVVLENILLKKGLPKKEIDKTKKEVKNLIEEACEFAIAADYIGKQSIFSWEL